MTVEELIHFLMKQPIKAVVCVEDLSKEYAGDFCCEQKETYDEIDDVVTLRVSGL